MTAPVTPALPRRRLAENLPHWTIVLSLVVLAATVAMAVFAPQLANFSPTQLNAAARLQPASDI